MNQKFHPAGNSTPSFSFASATPEGCSWLQLSIGFDSEDLPQMSVFGRHNFAAGNIPANGYKPR